MVRHVVYFLVEEQLHSNTWLVIAWTCDVSTSSDWSMQRCAQWVGAPRAYVQPPDLRVRIGFSPSPSRGSASARTTNNNHWQGTRTAESWRGPKKSKLCETAEGPALGQHIRQQGLIAQGRRSLFLYKTNHRPCMTNGTRRRLVIQKQLQTPRASREGE